MKKRILTLTLISVMLILLIANVSALTGSIGNARMILYPEVGEVLEKSILVKNINNVSLDINVTSEGDLVNSINIIDKEFTLLPNEEKKAYFTIKSDKKGTYESRVNIQFTPLEGNGFGLSSTVILIVGGSSDNSNNNTNIDPITGNIIDGNTKTSKLLIFGLISLFLFVIILILLVYLNKTKKDLNEKEEITKLKKKVKSREK